MSYLEFCTPTASARLRGSEYEHLNHLVLEHAIREVRACPSNLQRLYDLAPADFIPRRSAPSRPALGIVHESNRARDIVHRLKQDIGEPHRDSFITWSGQRVEGLALLLNTAVRSGDELLRFAARVYGQGEINGWIEGEDRAWAAQTIRKGRERGVFRADQNWEEVVDLLESDNISPVVMDYSVTACFPGPEIAGLLEEVTSEEDEADRWEAWGRIPPLAQWEMSMLGLRRTEGRGPVLPAEIGPAFVHDLTLVDLFADDYAARLDAAKAKGWLK